MQHAQHFSRTQRSTWTENGVLQLNTTTSLMVTGRLASRIINWMWLLLLITDTMRARLLIARLRFMVVNRDNRRWLKNCYQNNAVSWTVESGMSKQRPAGFCLKHGWYPWFRFPKNLERYLNKIQIQVIVRILRKLDFLDKGSFRTRRCRCLI